MISEYVVIDEDDDYIFIPARHRVIADYTVRCFNGYPMLWEKECYDGLEVDKAECAFRLAVQGGASKVYYYINKDLVLIFDGVVKAHLLRIG